MGRLLLGPTESVTVEQTDVMFKSEDNGQVRQAQTARALRASPSARSFLRLHAADRG
jgi:hypothetical protein